jgi:hypothetical protein
VLRKILGKIAGILTKGPNRLPLERSCQAKEGEKKCPY